jgi:hypothetical protein
MEKIEALEAVLTDPTRSARDKEIARTALDATQAHATDSAVSELLLSVGKPLVQVGYHEIHKFCSERGWRKARGVFDHWLDTYFKTENGRADAERIAGYLRQHDMDEWAYALELWKDSGFKDSHKLTDILQRIAANQGGVHTAEVVEQARQFLDELKRRTAP